MGANNQDGQFEIKELPIIGNYNVQRFRQFSPEDSANWYIVKGEDTKRPTALYPTMGRKHVNTTGFNQLIFGAEPRQVFKSINFTYIIIGNTIYRVDSNYNVLDISGNNVVTFNTAIWFTYLVINSIVLVWFVDGERIYVYQENTNQFYVVTDPQSPGLITVNGKLTKPGYIAAFGNRVAVSVLNSAQFFLSAIGLLDGSGNFTPATCFQTAGLAVFAQEAGIIRQMGVLKNQLYIFTDFTTGVWSNQAAIFPGTNTIFPWKQNSSYNWDFGIANPTSLDIDFGMLVFLAQNSDGLIQFMKSDGGQPESISTKAINTLLQRLTDQFGANNCFFSQNSNGFLYQYEDTIFYRMSGGDYTGNQILDQEINEQSIEYNFEFGDWHRCIEVNGERNRIQYHVYFNFKHLVSVVGDNTVYEMSGRFYTNEITNPSQTNPQAPDAYIAYPFRYERITPIISETDYAEFETEYVEIDFVFGDSFLDFSLNPFLNAIFLIDEQPGIDGNPQYIIDEQAGADGNPVFILADNSNYPTLNDTTYNAFNNPTIELYSSDDGGISFNTLDQRVFSQVGQYIWKMRWYQCGCSRNRVYKLICVSPVPIVVLGAVMNVRRVSGGSN